MDAPRIAILHQGCIPVYRRAFYDRLSQIRNREYVVIYGDPEPDSGILAAEPPFDFPSIYVRNRFLRLFGRSIAFQSAVRPIMAGQFSALVVGHEVKYIASDLLLVIFRLLGRPVLLWGHGRTNDYFKRQRSPAGRFLGRAVEWLKSRMIRIASGYMAYTEKGAEYVARTGMPKDRISVLWNTIDTTEAIEAARTAQGLNRDELRAGFGLSKDAIVLLFIGRLYPPKRVEALFAAARRLRDAGAPIEVLVVGTGPDEEALRRATANDGWCHFLGPIFEAKPLSRIFRAADAVVLPGKVGLVINHSFAYGLPVITCRQEVQPPEIEYLKDGSNGLILDGDDGLFRGLKDFAESRELQDRLTAGAIATQQELDLQNMVERFDAAVSRVLPHTDLGTPMETQRVAR